MPGLLRQAVSQVVVIALFADENVLGQSQPRRHIERPGADRENMAVLRMLVRLPEQRRAARLAKAPAHIIRRSMPADFVFAPEKRHRLATDIDRNPVMPAPAPALYAMAGIDSFPFAPRLESDSAAKAFSRNRGHHRYPSDRVEPAEQPCQPGAIAFITEVRAAGGGDDAAYFILRPIFRK